MIHKPRENYFNPYTNFLRQTSLRLPSTPVSYSNPMYSDNRPSTPISLKPSPSQLHIRSSTQPLSTLHFPHPTYRLPTSQKHIIKTLYTFPRYSAPRKTDLQTHQRVRTYRKRQRYRLSSSEGSGRVSQMGQKFRLMAELKGVGDFYSGKEALLERPPLRL